MKLNLQRGGASGGGGRRGDGIALVITLLMLSVITFLAVAFLAMTRRDRAATTAGLDVNGARAMNEAALARAQAEIISRMMAQTDALSYDYMVSRNYISPEGFDPKSADTTNVNYDIYDSLLPMSARAKPADWAQNIANLFYDPRPPVFIITNPAYSTNSDFRFWVDVNRNGRFESNGYIATVTNEFGNWGYSNMWDGEPEFIGVLSDPLLRHSPSNRFIGRYAFMVLPIGKTLDFNYIHNWAKGNYANTVSILTNSVGIGTRNRESDGFARDQGVGSWELNLAAMLDVLSPWTYETGPPENPYNYNPNPYHFVNDPLNNGPNTGYAFDDAEAILHYRYYPPARPSAPAGDWPPYILASLQTFYGANGFVFTNAYNGIDTYCVSAPLTYPFSFSNTLPRSYTLPWPGSYTSNLFYDPQDLFDTNKTSAQFVNRLMLAEARTNSFDRYTFQRMLECIGTGSSPEYGVYVYTNVTNYAPGLLLTTPVQEAPPTWLRTKVNINYDNTAQITNANAPYVPMPTNLTAWAPLAFFTNAADLLLRSQGYPVATNIIPIAVGGHTNVYDYQYGYAHFGITNIPIYSSTNPTVRYSAKIHQMLQLAANIYDATVNTNHYATGFATPGLESVYYPHVFRPQFSTFGVGTNLMVTIIGYTNVDTSTAQGRTDFQNQINKPFRTFTDAFLYTQPQAVTRDANIWGVPWVVGTVKGLPSFNQFGTVNSIMMTRKLMVWRNFTNTVPNGTNQFYDLSISNLFGAQLWNPYTNAFPRPVTCVMSNFASVILANKFSPGTPYSVSNYQNLVATNLLQGQWPGYTGNLGTTRTRSIILPFLTNLVSFPDAYYSEAHQAFYNRSLYPSYLPEDYFQKSFPIHSWVINVTNYVLYYMADRDTGQLLDFVNLGPMGTSLDLLGRLTNGIAGNTSANVSTYQVPGASVNSSQVIWNTAGASDAVGSKMSQGEVAQMQIGGGISGISDWPPRTPPSGEQPSYWPDADATWAATLLGLGNQYKVWCPFQPTVILEQSSTYEANDPLVHYTVDDLSWPTFQNTNLVQYVQPVNPSAVLPVTNYTHLGRINPRYEPWAWPQTVPDYLFKDPGLTSANEFDFPTNKFPGIGWLGRVHRGTPWQTVYFKPDAPDVIDFGNWLSTWAGTIDTYPTNDWVLPDLFTAVPNDNAARGLLSVNQTNDAAWAAVFSGIVVPTNGEYGWTIAPSNVYALVDGPGGINATRALETNGLFHHLGFIFKSPALMTNFLGGIGNAEAYTDEIAESVPQQILSLLKVGEPQFVIYSWGQSLRPKNLYFGSGANFGLCTNYEITGEVLTRTVCHVVSDPLASNPKIVVDSFNIEPGN